MTVATTLSITAPFICQAPQPPAYGAVAAPSGLGRAFPLFAVSGCWCPSSPAAAAWAKRLSPSVPQHPSRTCLAGCMNRFQSSKISFNRFSCRAWLPGAEIRVRMGMVCAETMWWLSQRATHTSTCLLREVQTHLCPFPSSGIIRFWSHNEVANRLQAPSTEDARTIPSEHCFRFPGRAHPSKELVLHKW